jgi:hypothetical protein
VFVIDAKNHGGTVRIVDKGSFFRSDKRLYVGGRDRSKLAKEMAWQVEAVRSALAGAGVDPLPSNQAAGGPGIASSSRTSRHSAMKSES